MLEPLATVPELNRSGPETGGTLVLVTTMRRPSPTGFPPPANIDAYSVGVPQAKRDTKYRGRGAQRRLNQLVKSNQFAANADALAISWESED
jgi:hypothetical protein